MTIISTSTSTTGEASGIDVAPTGFQVGFNGSTVQVSSAIFPPTLNKGSLSWTCQDNGGNYSIVCENSPFAQASTLKIQDPGVANANFTMDVGVVAAGTGTSSPGHLTGVTETLQFTRAGITYFLPLYNVNT